LREAVANIHTILPLDSSDVVFLGTSRGLFKGVPEKEEWTLVDGTSGLAVSDLDIDRGEKLLFLACPDGIHQLDLAEGKLTKHYLATAESEVTSVMVDDEQQLVYAGTGRGVYQSRDKGASWRIKSKGLSGASVETLEQSGSRLLCGTKSGLFFSDDQGESWSPSQGVFPIEIVSIKANPFSKDQVVAANMLSGYFFTSRNGGVNWEVTHLGPSLSKISSFAFTASGDLLAGTVTEGVFQIVPRSEGNRIAVAAKREVD
jgi:ligand-binding sensor domain-containing protein